MIDAAHVLLYADDAEAARAFFRDVLGRENVDAGDGWLIFALPPAELGVHPADGDDQQHRSGQAELWLMCTDVERTIAELRAKGVECPPPQDQGFGLVTRVEVPGYGPVGLYQPSHASPLPQFPA